MCRLSRVTYFVSRTTPKQGDLVVICFVGMQQVFSARLALGRFNCAKLEPTSLRQKDGCVLTSTHILLVAAATLATRNALSSAD